MLFIFTFDDTMFPRYRFSGHSSTQPPKPDIPDNNPEPNEKDKKPEPPVSIASHSAGEVIDIPPRPYRQQLALVHYFPDDKTTGNVHLPLAQHQEICWYLTNKRGNNNSSSNFINRDQPGLWCLFLPSLGLTAWWEVSPEAASQTVSKRLRILRVKLKGEHFVHV